MIKNKKIIKIKNEISLYVFICIYMLKSNEFIVFLFIL